MSIRPTVYISDATLRAIGPLGEDASLSGRLATIAARYDAIWREACPAFSELEWLALCSVVAGSGYEAHVSEHADPVRGILLALESNEALTYLGAARHADLVARLRTRPRAGQVAVAEVVERFNRADDLGAAPVRELLLAAGARITPTREPLASPG